MLWLATKRVIRSGVLTFWRNSFVSLASLLVMFITLFAIGSIIFTNALLTSTLNQIKDKVDINVYFLTSAQEEEMLTIKQTIERLPEVAAVEYVSREQALAEFKTRHADDSLTLQALEELDDNPFGAVLNVRAKEPSQYAGVAAFLKGNDVLTESGAPIIDRVNYEQNKVAIDTLSKIIDSGRQLGAIITIVLVFLSVVISFNTIRLAIYVSREEIGIMRLVGASTTYIRGPFVVTGILYGIIAGILTIALFYPLVLWLGPRTSDFFAGLNLTTYYIDNFVEIVLVIIGSGVAIGSVSSYLAVRKYLKI